MRRFLDLPTLVLFALAPVVCSPPAGAAELAVLRTGRALLFDTREEVAGGWLLSAADGGQVLVLREMLDHFEPAPAVTDEPAADGDGTEGVPATGRETLEQTVARIAAEFSVDPLLVEAVIEVESSFDPFAVSPKGAAGLMQLMPETARDLDVPDIFDPEQNIRGGVRYLRDLERRFGGDLGLALAAYNAGAGAVRRHGGIPPYSETREYVIRVLERYLARTGPVAGAAPGKS